MFTFPRLGPGGPSTAPSPPRPPGLHLPGSIMAKIDFAMPAAVFPQLDPGTVLLAFVTAVLTAIIGTFLPALRAASIQPVVAMQRS